VARAVLPSSADHGDALTSSKSTRRPLPIPPAVPIPPASIKSRRRTYQPSSPFFGSHAVIHPSDQLTAAGPETPPDRPAFFSTSGRRTMSERSPLPRSATTFVRPPAAADAVREVIEADERGYVSLLDYPRPITVYDEERLATWGPHQPHSPVAEPSWVDGAPDNWAEQKARDSLTAYLKGKEVEQEQQRPPPTTVTTTRKSPSPPRWNGSVTAAKKVLGMALAGYKPLASETGVLRMMADRGGGTRRITPRMSAVEIGSPPRSPDRPAKLRRRSDVVSRGVVAKRKAGADEFLATRYAEGVPRDYLEVLTKSVTNASPEKRNPRPRRTRSEGAVSLSRGAGAGQLAKSSSPPPPPPPPPPRQLVSDSNTSSSESWVPPAKKKSSSGIDQSSSNSTCSSHGTSSEMGTRGHHIGPQFTGFLTEPPSSFSHATTTSSSESNGAMFESAESVEYLADGTATKNGAEEDCATHVVRELRRLQRTHSHQLRLLFKVCNPCRFSLAKCPLC
jgi:hypothetical protein